jgi:hypothetical protein
MFKPKPLTVSLVYKKLKEIAQLTGNKVNKNSILIYFKKKLNCFFI